MLYIESNKFNTVYTTVSPHKTLSNPTYLMCVEHAQSGKKWSFIPQNVTSFTGSPYNDRYDLFRFKVAESGVDLTGGTRAWYYQVSPTIQYANLTQSANKGNRYIYMSWEGSPDGEWGVYIDSPNVGEVVTGGTWNIDGTSVPLERILDFGKGNIGIAVWIEDPYLDGKIHEYSFTTNSGRTFSDTLYLATMNEIDTIQPWNYLNSNCNVGVSPSGGCTGYATAYVGETTVDIDEVGQFYYSIREQTSKINTNCSLSGDKLETGLLYLTQDFTDTYYYTGGTVNVYDPTETDTYHILQEDEFHILTENNDLLTQE